MWFGLSLVGALFQAGQYTVVKGWGRHLHPFTIMLWTQAFSLAAFGAWARLAGHSFAAGLFDYDRTIVALAARAPRHLWAFSRPRVVV